MEIIKKIIKKQENLHESRQPVIAFLGDSVTQGCFEVYLNESNDVETVFDKSSAYHNYIARIFTTLYPEVPVI